VSVKARQAAHKQAKKRAEKQAEKQPGTQQQQGSDELRKPCSAPPLWPSFAAGTHDGLLGRARFG